MRCLWGIVVSLLLFSLSPARAEDDAATEKLWDDARAATGTDAVKLYLELVARVPKSHVARYELGEALYLAGDYAAALENYQQAIALGKDPGIGYMRAGKTLEKLKRPADAEAAYRKALQAAPESIAAQFGLASALYIQDKAAEALPLFERLAARDDEWGEVSREYVPQLHYDLGRYAEAAARARKLLEGKDEVAVRWVLARSLFKLRDYAGAESEFRKVANDPARREAAQYYIAASLHGQGNETAAERAYSNISRSDSEWGRAAQESEKELAGKPYFITLDYLGGYDTNVVQTNAQGDPAGKKDFFNQIFLDAEGRLWREGQFSLWAGGEHFSLHYPEAHDNDYLQDGVRLALRMKDAGPFNLLTLRYNFRYSQLDYQSYRKENRVDATAFYRSGPDRLRLGLSYGDNTYFRDFRGFDGPDAALLVDYTRRLPKWDHQIRLRFNLEYRWTQADVQERFSQRARLQYRAAMPGKLTGLLELGYRRDDFPQSQGVSAAGDFRQHRTDHRLSGEVRFVRDINTHLSVNWGYVYESQDSRRASQEYGRHEVSAGFTLSF